MMATKFHTFTFEIVVEQAKPLHLTMRKIAVWNYFVRPRIVKRS